MFNKTGVFGRSTPPVTRRDNPPVLGYGTPSNAQSTDKSVKSTTASPNTPGTLATAPATPAQPAATASDSLAHSAANPVSETSNDNVMGARLIVGPDVKLKGAEILDCDTLVVEGRVEATMDSRVIRIAENGSFSGKVSIDIAEIHGTFEGELTARSQLIIHSTGRVSGTIRYGKLVADEGGELCGDINTISESTTTTIKNRPVVEPLVSLTAAAR